MAGLHDKYIISKTSGEPVDPEAHYFVLRLDTDKFARRAAFKYAVCIMDENPEFFRDIIATIKKYDTEDYVERKFPDWLASGPHAFCETINAAPLSKWHIRPLTKVGLKLGGGADTKALCGKSVAWDLQVDITDRHLKSSSCPKCREIYEP